MSPASISFEYDSIWKSKAKQREDLPLILLNFESKAKQREDLLLILLSQR